MTGELPEGSGLVDNAVRDTVARLIDENAALTAQLAALQRRLEDVERLADMDTLTPLPNRRCFVREVARVVARTERYGDPAAVMFVDVDGLKAINDAHGHSAGDAALNHMAALLRRDVRAGDLVARIGGDEFGLLLDRLDAAAAIAKGAALQATAIANPLCYDGMVIPVRLSLGVATIAADDSVETLLARADRQMYAAKAAQRSAR